MVRMALQMITISASVTDVPIQQFLLFMGATAYTTFNCLKKPRIHSIEVSAYPGTVKGYVCEAAPSIRVHSKAWNFTLIYHVANIQLGTQAGMSEVGHIPPYGL